MAGAMRKMAVYLGLVEDEGRYEDYDEYDDYDRRDGRHEDRDEHRSRPVAAVRAEPRGSVSSMTERAPDRVPERTAERRAASLVDTQPVGGLDRIITIHPRAYNDAKTIGETFRGGTPVIMNLTDMDDSDAKRLVDFAAGLVFGCHGTIERVTNKVFLLSPVNVSVTAEDKARMAESGFFNQS